MVCPYCLSCRINSVGVFFYLVEPFFSLLKFIGLTFPHTPHSLWFAREVNMIASGLRHASGSSAHPPVACTQQEWLPNFQHQEVSGAGVILNVTTAFLGRNCSQYFFANCSEVKCGFIYVCLCTHPPTRICTIRISHKQKQSFKSNFGEHSVQKTFDC